MGKIRKHISKFHPLKILLSMLSIKLENVVNQLNLKIEIFLLKNISIFLVSKNIYIVNTY